VVVKSLKEKERTCCWKLLRCEHFGNFC